MEYIAIMWNHQTSPKDGRKHKREVVFVLLFFISILNEQMDMYIFIDEYLI